MTDPQADNTSDCPPTGATVLIKKLKPPALPSGYHGKALVIEAFKDAGLLHVRKYGTDHGHWHYNAFVAIANVSTSEPDPDPFSPAIPAQPSPEQSSLF